MFQTRILTVAFFCEDLVPTLVTVWYQVAWVSCNNFNKFLLVIHADNNVYSKLQWGSNFEYSVVTYVVIL